MRISDWSSDVCSSDLGRHDAALQRHGADLFRIPGKTRRSVDRDRAVSGAPVASPRLAGRSGPTNVCLGRGRLAWLYRGTLRNQTDDHRRLRQDSERNGPTTRTEIGREEGREREGQDVRMLGRTEA